MKAALVLSVSLIGWTASAQDQLTPEERAKSTASSLMGMLGLDGEQAKAVSTELAVGEMEVAELRAQCDKYLAEIDARMAPHYQLAGKAMSPEQNEKFMMMVANGEMRCPPSGTGTARARAQTEQATPPTKEDKVNKTVPVKTKTAPKSTMH